MEKITSGNKKKKIHMAPFSLEGKTLGKYRILEPLGRGGMAQVFKAYHPQLDRYVAIKVLRSDLVDDEEFLGRFRREARAVAGLRHPNIVQVFDFDSQDDLYYMVMELLQGNTLKSYLNYLRVNGKVLDRGELTRIFTDVLSGIAYAHEAGIIHRDIKPANIMLTKQGQAVVTDFGISQMVGGTKYTVSGALMGTLSYMAPEQAMQGTCDVHSDIYSLGITFFEALTGSLPFDADTPLAVLMKHVNDPLPMPRKFDSTIPESLERLTMKALAKNPVDRFQNAREMSDSLESAARQAGIKVPKSIHVDELLSRNSNLGKPVDVYSGDSRNALRSEGFAVGDTLVTKGERKNRGLSQFSRKIREVVSSSSGASDIRPQHVKAGVLYSVAAIAVINMAMLWIGGLWGWGIFKLVWPLEFIAAGVLLSALMSTLANPWLFIPTGILIGNGILFSYFTLTGNWQVWTLLWPLEPILLGLSIIAPFFLDRRGVAGRWLTRRIGLGLIVAALVVSLVTLIIGSLLLG